jgi:hypothetical protein
MGVTHTSLRLGSSHVRHVHRRATLKRYAWVTSGGWSLQRYWNSARFRSRFSSSCRRTGAEIVRPPRALKLERPPPPLEIALPLSTAAMVGSTKGTTDECTGSRTAHAQWTPSAGPFSRADAPAARQRAFGTRLPPGRLKPEKEQKEFR